MSGRIRSIKPELLDDELAAQLSDEAWRLWVSMWVLADDHGNLRAGDRYLAASVWQDTARDVSRPIQDLIAGGFLTAYSARGQRYVHINGWDKNQRIDNAGKPRVPRPDEDDGTWDHQAGGIVAVGRGDSRRVAASLEESRRVSESRGDSRRVAEKTTETPRGEPDESNQYVANESAESLGESPRPAANVGVLPLARSGGETTDLRSPITDPEGKGPGGDQDPRPIEGPLPEAVWRFEKRYWIGSYERAVDETRRPKSATRWTFPERAFNSLKSVVEKHCTGEDRRNITDWVGRTVSDFVRAVDGLGEDIKLWSGYGPDGLLRWFNEGRKGYRPPRREGPPSSSPTPAPEPKPLTPEQREEARLAREAFERALSGGIVRALPPKPRGAMDL